MSTTQIHESAPPHADPPWEYDDGFGTDSRRIDSHYPTLPLDQICELPVRDLATDAAVLFLWITSPFLDHATRVIEAWGFEYKSSVVWAKGKIGTGYWVETSTSCY
jgi:N6-adenosine-specific RNA methylase IME4